MDHQFPQPLFPSFYYDGPPGAVRRHFAGNWGSYEHVLAQHSSIHPSRWAFRSKCGVRAQTWRYTEPVPVPLFTPQNAFPWFSTPADPAAFVEQVQTFFMDHGPEVFGYMSELLGEHFNFKQGAKERFRKNSVHMWSIKKFLDYLKLDICQKSHFSRTLDSYSVLLHDVLPSIPVELLSSLLYEELTQERERRQFSPGATGGALAFIPFSQSAADFQHGCLISPGNPGMDCLNFHQVALQHDGGRSFRVNAADKRPFSFQLKHSVRQISSASLFNESCVAVRTDHLCGVWRLSQTREPHLLQTVGVKAACSCVAVSPHILGEVLLASESGAATLWTVGKGMQKVRKEDSNLYFNATSQWRWCEFTAHPRVMVYADRTGAELSDIRAKPTSCHTLFRISSSTECRVGERLMLSKYLGDVHPFHHLVTTQYSAFVMDERLPCIPMLKWDHMMQAPPMFCHASPGPTRTARVLLGSQRSQEIVLLQYSGGRAEACSRTGPPQALLRPRDSLKHLPIQIPHRQDKAIDRLSSPVAGLTCVQESAGDKESICVFQLTEAGDIFYQIVEREQPDSPGAPGSEGEPRVQGTARIVTTESTPEKDPPPSDLEGPALDTSSDEDAIGPGRLSTWPSLVPETPERSPATNSDASSEDSESDRKKRTLTQLRLQVVVNVDPEPGDVDPPDAVEKDGEVVEPPDSPPLAEETLGGAETTRPPDRRDSPQLSQDALATWKHWLQKLIKKSQRGDPRDPDRPHLRIPTDKILMQHRKGAKGQARSRREHAFGQKLRARMSDRSLLVGGDCSPRAPDILPFPSAVGAEDWEEPLSQRLSHSWQGEDMWRDWWDDRLGLNVEEKKGALRWKRQKEKEAKRASGRHLSLTSFAPSAGCSSTLDDWSDSFGYTSAASEASRPYTDWEAGESADLLVEPCAPVAAAPVAAAGAQKVADGEPRTDAGSRDVAPASILKPAAEKRKRPADDDLHALIPSQDKPPQHSSRPPGAGDAASLAAAPPSWSSRLQSSQATFGPKVTAVWSGSLGSQSSQGRAGASQGSQSKKKKSRMGF